MASKGQTKYEDDWPERIIEVVGSGASYSAFCAEKGISEQGFRVILNANPEFKEAYALAKQMDKERLERLAEQHLVQEPGGPKLDTKLWSMLMRMRHGMTEHRKVKLDLTKAKTAAEQYKLIAEKLAEGDLTAQEAALLVKSVEGGANIYEKTELVERVKELEDAQLESESSALEGAQGTD